MNSHLEIAYITALKKKGINKSIYQQWIDSGNTGTKIEFIQHIQTLTPYQLWLELGNVGTEMDYINSK
jgi:hypothetical protein